MIYKTRIFISIIFISYENVGLYLIHYNTTSIHYNVTLSFASYYLELKKLAHTSNTLQAHNHRNKITHLIPAHSRVTRYLLLTLKRLSLLHRSHEPQSLFLHYELRSQLFLHHKPKSLLHPKLSPEPWSHIFSKLSIE